MAFLLSREVPELAEVAEVRESFEGEGLGLFARRKFELGEPLCQFRLGDGQIMTPKKALSDKLNADDFGALAFQVLRATRSEESSAWKDWAATGVQAPDTHPLKLLVSDPQLAKRLWSSTTCGGRMCGMALQVRDDLELLQGGATLEEWTDCLALVLSRSVCEDGKGRPLLVMGLDLLQAGEDPTVKIKPIFEKAGQNIFGGGGKGPSVFVGLELIAIDDIEAGQELTMSYLPIASHAGGYLERYGFVPKWLQGYLAPGAVQLTFNLLDEEDPNVGTKESMLEDLDFPRVPMDFILPSSGISAPRAQPNWDDKSELDKMVQMIRFKTCGGTDSFLLDSVFYNDFFYHCARRISKQNEVDVCKTILEECDRWLARFDALEEQGPDPDDELSQVAAGIRRSERILLGQVKTVFQQELDVVTVDDSIKYFLDRRLLELFPAGTDYIG